MKILTKSTLKSILKTGLFAMLLGAFMLICVDLFKNLDTYISYEYPKKVVLLLCLLNLPNAILTACGPAFLFSVTYYISMLSASNELICILNSGVSYRKIVKPIIISGFAIGCLYFIFNETVNISCINKKNIVNSSYSSYSIERNNSRIALSDPYQGFSVYAENYLDSSKTLLNVTIIETDSNGNLVRKTNAVSANYDEESKLWTLNDVINYFPEGNEIYSFNESSWEEQVMDFEPQLFRNISLDIATMDLKLAKNYIDRLKVLNPKQFASSATEFYKRVLGCLTPIIMVIIACSMNFRFRKNVLFFSIICSICTLVVYYVIQMITIMLAEQGVIRPAFGMLIPFALMMVLLAVFSYIVKRD